MVTDVGIKELWQGQCFSGSLKLWIIICPMSVLALTPGWEPAMSPVHTLEPNQFYLFRPNESNICWGVFSHSLITWSQAVRKHSVKCLIWPFSAHCFKPYWLQTWHESKGELGGSVCGGINRSRLAWLTDHWHWSQYAKWFCRLFQNGYIFSLEIMDHSNKVWSNTVTLNISKGLDAEKKAKQIYELVKW